MSLGRILRRTLAGAALALAAALAVAWWSSGENACDHPAAPRGALMKAVVQCEYGSPDVLRVEQVERPAPADDQVLVRVRAASLNPLDWHLLRGEPYVGRLGMGLRKPKATRIGVDFAGTVEAVGAKVTRFRPGDAVFGGRTGAFAQYVAVREDRAIVAKPAGLTFEEAAAIPVAGVTALQGLRDRGRLQPGQRVLVNGASGGVGTFAVQIAKALGGEVTGVCSTRNAERVRSLGADRVVDYTRQDFAALGERWDLLLDNVGNRSLLDCRRALAPRGTYVMVGGPAGRWVDPIPRMLAAFLLSRVVSQDMRMFLADLNAADLAVLRDLAAAGKLRPVIDRRYPLDEIAAAIAYLAEGHARGKVVLTVD
jgi:NADPH:quinone reductase-like Zn-dependent oxidoreductase